MQGDGQQLDRGGPGAWRVCGGCGVDVGERQWCWQLERLPDRSTGFCSALSYSCCPSVLSPPGSDAQQLWYNPFTAVCLRPAHHCCAPLPAPATLPLQNSSLGGDVCPSPQLCEFAHGC